MRYLIDTNILINIVVDDYISNNVWAILDDYEKQIYVSSESVKEFIQLIQTERVILEKNLRSREVFDIIENEFELQVKYVT